MPEPQSADQLAPLPKLEDYQPEEPSTALTVARSIAIIAAGAAGNSEQAALLFRTFAMQDEAKERTALDQFNAALAAATESRQQARFASQTQQENIRIRQEAERIGISKEGQALDRERFEEQKRQFDIEMAAKRQQLGAQGADIEAQERGQYGQAVDAFNREVAGILERAQAPLSGKDILSMDPASKIELLATPPGEQRQQMIRDQIMRVGGLKMEAAYGADADQVADAIAAQIDIQLGRVPERFQEQFLETASGVLDATTARFKAGADDLTPEEANKVWTDLVAPQLEEMLVSGREIDVLESTGIVRLIEQKNVPATLTLDSLSAAVDRAVLNAATRLGLDINDQEQLSDRVAMALWRAVDIGEPVGSPFALLGESDPVMRELQSKQQELTKQIAILEAQGQAAAAVVERKKLPALEAKITARKAARQKERERGPLKIAPPMKSR